jgi:hypothetical protein
LLSLKNRCDSPSGKQDTGLRVSSYVLPFDFAQGVAGCGLRVSRFVLRVAGVRWIGLSRASTRTTTRTTKRMDLRRRPRTRLIFNYVSVLRSTAPTCGVDLSRRSS